MPPRPPTGFAAVLDLVGGDALADAPRQVRDVARVASVADPAAVLGMGGRYVFVRPERDHLDALAALADEGRLGSRWPRPTRWSGSRTLTAPASPVTPPPTIAVAI